MNGEVIKSFLVGLGFGVDQASLTNFNRAISSAAARITGLYAATDGAAAGIVFGISKISQGFEDLGYEFRIIAPMLNKTLMLRNELLKAYSAAGINITKVIQNSVKLNFSLAKTKFAFEAIYKSVASRFFPLLTQGSDNLRRKIYANLPRIQDALEHVIKAVFKMFDALTTLGERAWSVLMRVYDFFVKLDEATNGWSTYILAAIAAWKLLNLSFLATPLGILFSLGLAILALYDDLETFKEGGESFINWGSETTRVISGILALSLALAPAILAIAAAVSIWRGETTLMTLAQLALNLAMSLNPIGLTIIAVTALLGLLALLDSKWHLFGGRVTEFFSNIGGKVLGLVGAGSNFVPQPAPYIPGSQYDNRSIQNLSIQTNTSISGVADANQAARLSAGATDKDVQDWVRNLQGG